MCARDSCMAASASFFTWLAFITAVVALFAPFWFTIEENGVQKSKGIVVECTEPFSNDNRSCEFTIDDAWDDLQDTADDILGDNFLIVQITWIAGTALLLLNAVLTFLLFCDRCKNRCCTVCLTLFVFVAAACLAASVIIFGLENKNKFERDEDEGYYDWGYYVALGSAGCAVLASLFLSCTICTVGKSV